MSVCHFHKYITVATVSLSVALLLLTSDSTQQAENATLTETVNNLTAVENLLQELINDFTYVMHLPTDNKLRVDVVSKFRAALEQVSFVQTQPSDNTSELISTSLLHQALYGAFKVRGHVIKDDLSSGRRLTIRQHQFDSTSPWKLDLLQLILQSKLGRVNLILDNMTPVELAVKLQLVSAAHLLVRHGASVCYSYAPLNCTGALEYAVINENVEAIDFVVRTFLKELQTLSHQAKAVNVTEALNYFFFQSWNMQHSAMDIACYHCLSGVSCQALSHLMLYISNCNFICKLKKNLPFFSEQTSKRLDGHSQRTASSTKHSDMSNSLSVRKLFSSGFTGFTRILSGWTVYGGFNVGDNGCDLPRVRADTLHHSQFEEFFVNSSIPVVIEGLTDSWKLRKEWTKKRLLEKWSHLDLLVGPIPYGEVFGEKHGYATVEEFVSYMDAYAEHPSIKDMDNYRGYPLYVFDSQVLQHHFKEDYNISYFMDVSTWQFASHIYQFILGPVGSGAPFHFHCNAVNALIYGRKKWLLYPPGSAIYSKVHPLKWYQRYGSQMTTDKPLECVQNAGDIIYVPSQWTHATINLDECIGLAVEFDSGKC